MAFGTQYPGESSRPKLKPKAKAKAKSKAPAKKKTTAPATPAVDPLQQTAQAATNLQFAGAEAALAGQGAVHQQMQANVPAWFQEYQNALAQSTNRTQQAYAGAVGAQANTAATASALDAQQRAALGQAAQADAATRGAVVDPAIAAQGQQAAASRQAMLAAQTGLTAGLGGAETAYRSNREVVGAGQKLSARQDEAQRGRNLGVQAIDLARQKGLALTKNTADLLDAEHQRALEDKAFGLNEQKAVADVQLKTAGLQERRRARVTTGRQKAAARNITGMSAAETARHNRAQEALGAKRAEIAASKARGGSGKDQYGNTPIQRRSARDAYDKAKSLAKTYGDAAPDMDADELASFLVTKNINPLYAKGAAQAIRKKLDPATRKRLAQRGVVFGAPKAGAKLKATPRPNP